MAGLTFSEKYQNFLDKINNRIPIKSITKPLDKKNPLTSLFLFFLLVVIILFLIFNPFSFKEKADYNEVVIKLADDTGNILEDFSFVIKDVLENRDLELQTDSTGKTIVTLDTKKAYDFFLEKVGYKRKVLSIDPNQLEHKITLEVYELPSTSSKTLMLLDSQTKELIKENMSLTITCENTNEVINPTASQAENGQITVEVPANCGRIVATAASSTYFAQNILVSENQNQLLLNKINDQITVGSGEAKIFVKSGTNILDGIEVRIFKEEDPINPVSTKETPFGAVYFKDLEVGEYIVSINDIRGNYQSTDQRITIEKDKLTEAVVQVLATGNNDNPNLGDEIDSNIVTKEIIVIVKDLLTSSEIIDLEEEVIVKILEDGNLTKDVRAYAPGGVSFNIEENKSYTIVVTAKKYINTSRVISPNVNEYNIFLEPITESNVSNINIVARDEDDLFVSRATLLVYDANTGFIDARFDPILTDLNGSATFRDVPKGNYFIKLRKSVVDGSSENFNHLPPTDTNRSVNVVIGNGTININIKNNYTDPVADAQITIYNSDGTIIGSDTASATGTYSRELKADKIVYLKISKEGYLDYYTNLLPIIKNQTTSKEIMLYRSQENTLPIIDYLGVYDLASDSLVDSLTQNKQYNFKFRVVSPNNASNVNFGLNFIVGGAENVNDDFVFIRSVTQNLGQVTYYESENGSPLPQGSPAKYVKVNYQSMPNGVYEVTIPMQVSSANRGDAVPMFYFGYSLEDTTFREQEIYYIDAEQLCDDSFCISGQILDLSENISEDLTSSLNVSTMVNNNYRLEYTITNAENNTYSQARFSIKNTESSSDDLEIMAQAIDIKRYSLSGLINQTRGEQSSPRHKIPDDADYLSIPQINVYDSQNIDLNITPISIGTTKLNHRILADQAIVYDKPITFGVSNQYQFNISYEPLNIVPNTPFVLTVSTRDTEGNPVVDGIVNIYQKIGNNTNTITSGTYRTNQEGMVQINMPSLYVNEKIIIEVQKAMYYATPVEIVVSEDVVEARKNNTLITLENPLEINIHKTELEGEIEKITLKNKTEFDLVLKSFLDTDLSFSNSSFVNLSQTLKHLNSQVTNNSFVIPANGEKELNIRASPFSNAIIDLFEPVEVVGSISARVSKVGSSSNYNFEIPINVKLSVGEGVDVDDCLIIQGAPETWESIITGNGQQEITFTLLNNCVAKGNDEQHISLKNIRAKMSQEGDRYGAYTLRIEDKSITLSEGSYQTIITGVEPRKEYSVTLRYNSYGANFADIKSNIYINAQVETNNGLSYVNKAKELALKTDISVLNIADCIEFFDDGKKINNQLIIPSEKIIDDMGDPKTLIIKNNCSDKARFEVFFCGENKEYAGCQGLNYTNMSGSYQNKVSFNIGETSQEVGIVKPSVPGGYVILAKIKPLSVQGLPISGATVEKKLKINVQHFLYMQDPFIEVSRYDDQVYRSPTVNLLNKDIDDSAWDYATTLADDGFSNYMSNLFPYFNSKYDNIKFVTYDRTTFTNDAYKRFTNDWVFIVSPATAAIDRLLSTFSNNFTEKLTNQTPFIYTDLLNISENQEKTKTISLDSSDAEIAFISIWDIQAMRYKKIYNISKEIKGKLIKDRVFSEVLDLCTGSNLVLGNADVSYVSDPRNCSNLRLEGNLVDGYISKINCDGGWNFGRKQIKVTYNNYVECRYNETIWPEQAGKKPIQFTVPEESEIYERLENGDQIYKEIEFYPTLDDSLEEIDPAFVGAEDIGKFRFAIYAYEKEPKITTDQEIVKCMTDTGKLGDTGPGMVPKIALDWAWSFDDLNKCANTYCDATQLSQEILNRIKKAEDVLNNNRANISCPKSTQQLSDELLDGTYSVNATPQAYEVELPVNKIGINEVNIGQRDGLLAIRASVQNRTALSLSGNLSINLGDQTLSKIELLGCFSGTNLISCQGVEPEWHVFDIDQPGTNIVPVTITPVGDDDTTEVIFIYGTEDAVLEGSHPLNISFEVSPREGVNVLEFVNGVQNTFNSNLDLSIQEYVPNNVCQIPATSANIAGIDFIDYWFNESVYGSIVQSNWNQEDVQLLKNTLTFDAYLMTDNYNQSFKDAFDRAYGGKASKDQGIGVSEFAFLANPGSLYTDDYLSPLFKDNLEFILRYSTDTSGVNISTPGLYRVRIDLFFNNSEWKMKNVTGAVDLNATVSFEYLRGPDHQSVFYRLPFNGFTGLNSSGYDRQNYGLSYVGDEILITDVAGLNILTKQDNGSNPLRYIFVTRETDFYKTNSDVESRGNVLAIYRDQINSNNFNMVFSPSVATPVLMNVRKDIVRPFSAYYQLIDKTDNYDQPVYGQNNLLFWTGFGDHTDFSGDTTQARFVAFSDRMSRLDEPASSSYAVDWDNVSRRGQVNLRTIIYTPYTRNNQPKNYTLISKSTQDPSVKFIKNLEDFSTSVSLPDTQETTINSIRSVFENIENGNICVTNSEDGLRSEYYWNPQKIYPEDSIYTGNFDGFDLGFIN
jgi:hypothetical protein